MDSDKILQESLVVNGIFCETSGTRCCFCEGISCKCSLFNVGLLRRDQFFKRCSECLKYIADTSK